MTLCVVEGEKKGSHKLLYSTLTTTGRFVLNGPSGSSKRVDSQIEKMVRGKF